MRSPAVLALLLVSIGCPAGEMRMQGGDSFDSGAIAADASTQRDAPIPFQEDPVPEGCLPEQCGNGLDDDCDGHVDDGCVCTVGERLTCFRGAASQRNRGVCADGQMLCEGFEFGEFSDCVGDVLASDEVCDEAAQDEDCDGVGNENCECSGDSDLACGSDVGECVAGIQRCIEGMRTACEGETAPTAELCNGLDDDCDDIVDEGLTQTCGQDEGSCSLGVSICSAGTWGECSGIAPIAESCNAQDDDCDGRIDEEISENCGSDVGSCSVGRTVCTMGTFGECVGEIRQATESCNGSDDDCDGMTDEALTRSCGSDVGLCQSGMEHCSAGAWGSCTNTTVASTELCDGANDEDCDGQIDENCDCVRGRTRSCGSAVGACEVGSETCTADGHWSSCRGAIEPSAELCDGIDNDCDGVTDEGCDCRTGSTRSCGSAVGACRTGRETCSSEGHWGVCVGSTSGSSETCNGVDDDCDGQTDESLTRSCGSDTGECSSGVSTCRAGSWGMCVGSTEPGVELCDGRRDENCNGVIDEGCTCTTGARRSCGSDVGACALGQQSCNARGEWASCMGATNPTTELCDGIDNDCDGITDEGCDCRTGTSRACGSDVGACQAGRETCSADGHWGVCIGAISGSSEICNGIDDDCNGQTDESLTRSCGSDTGECMSGTSTCRAGSWGICVGSTEPRAELCDGRRDENCNGVVDEGCTCTTGSRRDCGSDVGACAVGTQTCDMRGEWASCVGATHPTTELCDGIDNDCDGVTDEGCDCRTGATRSCGSDVGACQAGRETCSADGHWGVCTGAVPGSSETCNGVDDDCNGEVDEALSRSCGSDIGECSTGLSTCRAGSWGMCVGSVEPRAEQCDGRLDDNCNGVIAKAVHARPAPVGAAAATSVPALLDSKPATPVANGRLAWEQPLQRPNSATASITIAMASQMKVAIAGLEQPARADPMSVPAKPDEKPAQPMDAGAPALARFPVRPKSATASTMTATVKPMNCSRAPVAPTPANA